jgi:fructan beta-fructosidase
MSLPRRLSFLKDDAGLALVQEPVVAPLRISSAPLAPDKPVAVPYELEMQFSKPEAKVFGVRLFSDKDHWTEIGFDTEKNEFYIDRTESGTAIDKDFPGRTAAPLASGRPFDLKVIVDRSSVEAYAQLGTIAMTSLIFPLSPDSSIKVFPERTSATGMVWKLKSIWGTMRPGK